MLITLAWRNLWRNKVRSSIMIAAMVFGLMGVVVMVGFINGMSRSMVNNVIAYQTAHLQIHERAFLLNPDLKTSLREGPELLETLAANPAIAAVSARQRVDGMMASANHSRGIQINGIEPQQEAKVTKIADSIVKGEWLNTSSRNPIVISKRSADKFKLRVGSKLVLTFSDFSGQVSGAAFRVIGLYATPSSNFDEMNVWVLRPDLSRYTGTSATHEITIRLTDPEQLDEVKAWIDPQLPSEQIVRDWRAIQPMLAAMLASMKTSNLIMLTIFVLALGFGIINIMLMAVFERTREFGMLMAVGMSKSAITVLVMLEALFLGITGAVTGVLASIAMIAIMAHTGLSLGSMAEGLNAFGIDTLIYPFVNYELYLQTLIMVMVTSLVAALYPARQVLKKRPADAIAMKH